MVSIKRIAGQVTLNRNYFIDVKFIAFNLESRPYWYCPCLQPINQLTDNPGNILFDKLEIVIKKMKYLLIFIRKKNDFVFI